MLAIFINYLIWLNVLPENRIDADSNKFQDAIPITVSCEYHLVVCPISHSNLKHNIEPWTKVLVMKAFSKQKEQFFFCLLIFNLSLILCRFWCHFSCIVDTFVNHCLMLNYNYWNVTFTNGCFAVDSFNKFLFRGARSSCFWRFSLLCWLCEAENGRDSIFFKNIPSFFSHEFSLLRSLEKLKKCYSCCRDFDLLLCCMLWFFM